MKKTFMFALLFSVSLCGIAQGKGKGKEKSKAVISHTNGSGPVVTKSKSSKNQPKKVEAALFRDYPTANNVVWSKYKGDYTATFNNGPWRSTAVYHANGDRRDTRTPLTRSQLPGTIWDNIFKRDNITPVSYIQIEQPTNAEKIFRILTANKVAVFYNADGNKIQYNY